MVHIGIDEFIELAKQGVKGNAAGFTLLCRRIVSRLKKNNPDAATQLAEVLAGEIGMRGTGAPTLPVDSDSRRYLLQENKIVILKRDPIWTVHIATVLNQVLKERRESVRLIEAGFEPVRSVIFIGPPGVGKTLAAQWLARELNIPLLTLDLASVMSSFLGKTGTNIKSVIDYAKGFPCVLLLDEFDAIAKKRDDYGDVGELKRLVTVLLQAIDEWPASSLLVAATNHPDILDPAVWRRFDIKLDFDNPPSPIIADFLITEGVPSTIAKDLSQTINGISFADLQRIVTNAKKQSILEGINFTDELIRLASAHASHEKDNYNERNSQIIRMSREGISQRKIAKALGISHPTVGRIIKEHKGNQKE